MKSIKGRGIRVRIALFSFVVLFTCLERVEGDVVQCYVCSWDNGKLNITDTCTHYNFREEYASTVNCTTGGCEATTIRRSKNDEIIHFRRNCLNPRKGLQPDDKCYAREEKMEYLNICECHSNLCNSAQLSIPRLNLLWLGAFLTIGLIFIHSH